MAVDAVAAAPSRLKVRAVIGDAARLYRRQWRHLIPSALVVTLGAAMFALVLEVIVGGTAGSIGTAFVAIFTLFFLPLWLQALDLHERVVASEDDASFRAAVVGVRGRLPALTGAILLIAFLETLGFLLLLVPGFILAVRWSLTMPAMIIEGLGVRAGMRRSRELVRGNGWRVLGTILLNGLILGIPVIVLTLGFAAFMSLDYAEFFRTITVESLLAPFGALVLTSLYDALAPGDLPEPRHAAVQTSFSREARVPALAGRLIAIFGAIIVPLSLFKAFFDGTASGFELLETADLLAVELGVACVALGVLSFFSRTRLPLLAIALLGFFSLGQSLPDKPFLEHLASGGYLSLIGSLLLCGGALYALLSPAPSDRPVEVLLTT
jgi:glycerophosphoryl diester phosphodiesterase family protein